MMGNQTKQLGAGPRWIRSGLVLLALIGLVFGVQANKGGVSRLAVEDGIGTLPASLAPQTGFVLTGTVAELLEVVSSTTAMPSFVHPMDDGRLSLLFQGGAILDLDREALSDTGVRAFAAVGVDFQSARATLSSGPVELDRFTAQQGLMEIPIELFDLAGSTTSFAFDLVHQEAGHHRLVLAPQGPVLRVGVIQM